MIADWLSLHEIRSGDLIREAESARRRRVLPPRRPGRRGSGPADGPPT